MHLVTLFILNRVQSFCSYLVRSMRKRFKLEFSHADQAAALLVAERSLIEWQRRAVVPLQLEQFYNLQLDLAPAFQQPKAFL